MSHPAGPEISVIIPCFNEERRLPAFLDDLCSFLATTDRTFEIVVVDDGSTDRTAAVAASYTDVIDTLRILVFDDNRGKGHAVRHGMLEARGAIRLFLDADGSTPAAEIPKLVAPLGSGVDVVVGSIGMSGADVAVPQRRYRVAAGIVGNRLIQWILLPGISDTQRGCKAMTEHAVSTVFPDVATPGFGFDLELLVHARRAGLRVVEIPVRWVHKPGGVVGLGVYLRVLVDLVRLRMRFGKVPDPR